MTEFKFHEYCQLFPFHPGTLNLLTEDMRQNGLLEPIVLLDGKILDGRHRYLACKQADVEIKTVDFNGNDPLAYVVAKNLHRRQLTESQRATIAAEIANMRRGHNNQEQSANLPIANSLLKKELRHSNHDAARISQKEAAQIMNVSTRSVGTAKKILNTATPEVIQQIKEGKKTLHAAATESKAKTKPKSNPRKKTIARTDVPENREYVVINLGTPKPITVNFPLPENDTENGQYPLSDYIGNLFELSDADIVSDAERYNQRLNEMRAIGKALTALADIIIDIAD